MQLFLWICHTYSLAHLVSGSLPQGLPEAEFCLLSFDSSKLSEIIDDL